MENLEILKDTLSAETYAAVEAETKDSDIKLADLSKGGYVGIDKYNALDKQNKDIQALLDTKTAEYDQLAETAGDNNALKDQIENLKTSFEQEKTKMLEDAQKEITKSRAMAHIVNKYHPNDVKDILPHIDFSKVSTIDDKLIGVDEQVEPLTTEKAYLFAKSKDGDGGNSGLPHNENLEENLAAIRASFGLK